MQRRLKIEEQITLLLHAVTILVHVLICARVDYGDAVYIGPSSTNASISFNMFSILLPVS